MESYNSIHGRGPHCRERRVQLIPHSVSYLVPVTENRRSLVATARPKSNFLVTKLQVDICDLSVLLDRLTVHSLYQAVDRISDSDASTLRKLPLSQFRVVEGVSGKGVVYDKGSAGIFLLFSQFKLDYQNCYPRGA